MVGTVLRIKKIHRRQRQQFCRFPECSKHPTTRTCNAPVLAALLRCRFSPAHNRRDSVRLRDRRVQSWLPSKAAMACRPNDSEPPQVSTPPWQHRRSGTTRLSVPRFARRVRACWGQPVSAQAAQWPLTRPDQAVLGWSHGGMSHLHLRFSADTARRRLDPMFERAREGPAHGNGPVAGDA